MKTYNNITATVNFVVLGLMIFIWQDMISHPVNIRSDGQAGIGMGVSVLILQTLRLSVLLLLMIFAVVVFRKRAFKQKLVLFNFALFALNICIGFLILR